MFKRTSTAPVTPPSLDEIFSTASGASAFAKSGFRQAIEDLELANAGFTTAEQQAAAEIVRVQQEAATEVARLEGVRAEAAAGRQSNAVVIENLRNIVGE